MPLLWQGGWLAKACWCFGIWHGDRSKLKMVPISEAPRAPEAVSARSDRNSHGPASDSALELALG
jgi:hypothetical protein